jgi:hypothetical protein
MVKNYAMKLRDQLVQRLYGLFFRRESSHNETAELASVYLTPSDIPADLQDDARARYIAQLVTALKYLRAKPAEERLAHENFDETLIPEKFHDHFTHRLLSIPYHNIGIVDDLHPLIIDESTAKNQFANDSRYVLDQIKSIELANFLRTEIQKVQHAAYMSQKRIELDKLELVHRDEITRRQHRFDLLIETINLHDIPDELLDPISSDLLQLPVRIRMNDPADKGYMIDWNTLKNWWNHHPDKYRHPLYDGQVCELTFDQARFNQIGQFISLLEQLLAVKQIVTELDNATPHHATLTSKKILPEQVPDRLIKCNLSGEIITHPIVLDKKYLVDYQTYMNWMNNPSHPERRFKNFYTDRLIDSIAYDYKLKAELDAYVKEPDAPKEVLRSRPLKIKRLLRKVSESCTLNPSKLSQNSPPAFSLLQTHWRPIPVIRSIDSINENFSGEARSSISSESSTTPSRTTSHWN